MQPPSDVHGYAMADAVPAEVPLAVFGWLRSHGTARGRIRVQPCLYKSSQTQQRDVALATADETAACSTQNWRHDNDGMLAATICFIISRFCGASKPVQPPTDVGVTARSANLTP